MPLDDLTQTLPTSVKKPIKGSSNKNAKDIVINPKLNVDLGEDSEHLEEKVVTDKHRKKVALLKDKLRIRLKKLKASKNVQESFTYDDFNKIANLVDTPSLSEGAEAKLLFKAISSGIPFKTLVEVYERGATEQKENKTFEQTAFERVNSFINGGKAWEIDNDLTEGLKNPKDNPCWKGYKPVGTKEKGGKTVPNCVPEETTTQINRDFKEAFENHVDINEISTETKMRYVAKAASSTNEPKSDESHSDYVDRVGKRLSGIKKALRKTNPSNRFQKESVQIPDKMTRKLKKVTKQLDKSVKTHHKQSKLLKKLVSLDVPDVQEEKNCGCGKNPCITYGKQ